MSKTKPGKASGRPWRDNIEAITVSIVTIVLFKYFVLEAYKIPTGSMQPTLMGSPEAGIFDRVGVDKFSYHYRDPERFEVVVFKYPLNRAQNFIKRLIGMPGEELEIRDGDLWRRPLDSDEPWQVLRRPRPVQNAQLRLLDTTDEWSFDGAGWRFEDSTLTAPGPGSAQFPRTLRAVRDGYTDGYPKGLVDVIETRNKNLRPNVVSDLRVTAKVIADAATTEVELVLLEGTRRFHFVLPGPAAPEGARPRIEAIDPEGGISRVTSEASEPWRLSAGRGVRVLAQNLDDLVELEIKGGPELSLEIPPAGDVTVSGVKVAFEGGGGRAEDLAVRRDIYYTTAGQRVTRWAIPEGHYLMLGDNSQDSSDGRDWALTGIRLEEGEHAGEVIRGNHRPSENPREVRLGDGEGLVFLRDELGELHVYPEDSVERVELVPAPLVARESIVGRAVVVVWPLRPKYGVYRLKWVR